MAFTYDLQHANATLKDTSLIRFWLGDNVADKGVMPNGANLQDDELAQLLTDEGNDPMRGVAAGLELLANAWAAHAGQLSLGPESEVSSQASAYADRAIQFRKTYGAAPRSSGSTSNNGGFALQTRPAGSV